MRSSDHITDTLAKLHWLRVPERIKFKVAVLTYKVLHESKPRYLSPFVRIADLPGRQGLRSADTDELLVPTYNLSTVGTRAFPVAGPEIWNTLPDSVTSSESLSTLRHELKHFLFQKSLPGIKDSRLKH